MADHLRAFGVPPPASLPPATRLGAIQLQVSDLARSVDYYERVLGLTARRVSGDVAHLTAGDDPELIELVRVPGTRPVRAGTVLGLFHFALLLPSREALGRFIRRLNADNIEFGAADHLVSEAVYLWDPDGLGIEVYADRPPTAWSTRDRQVVMTTERLDDESVMAAAGDRPWSGMPSGTALGHLHLSVEALEPAQAFFHQALGFDLTLWSYPGALFMSAGGYHHHLGTNTWSAGARRPTSADARLLSWTLVLPSPEDVAAAIARVRAAGAQVRDDVVVDPWGTELRLTSA